MPLQDLTVPPENSGFTDATKQAFYAGWYQLDAGMPREAGGRKGTVRYPDGATETVPLVTMAQAYAELDQGDPPPCPGPSVPPAADAPPADGASPDSAVSDEPLKSCVSLTRHLRQARHGRPVDQPGDGRRASLAVHGRGAEGPDRPGGGGAVGHHRRARDPDR